MTRLTNWTRDPYTDPGVPKCGDRRSGSPTPSAGLLSLQMAGCNSRRRLPGVVTK